MTVKNRIKVVGTYRLSGQVSAVLAKRVIEIRGAVGSRPAGARPGTRSGIKRQRPGKPGPLRITARELRGKNLCAAGGGGRKANHGELRKERIVHHRMSSSR